MKVTVGYISRMIFCELADQLVSRYVTTLTQFRSGEDWESTLSSRFSTEATREALDKHRRSCPTCRCSDVSTGSSTPAFSDPSELVTSAPVTRHVGFTALTGIYE